MRQRANKRTLGQSSWHKYWPVSVCLQCSIIIKHFPGRETANSRLNEQYSFQERREMVEWRTCFHKWLLSVFIYFLLLFKNVTSLTREKSMGPIGKHCHCLIELPVVLFGYIIWASFLWPWCVSVPPNVRGGGVAARGHRGRTQRGNQSSLSLCDSISRLCTHEWMPRHLSSEPSNESRTRKALVRTRRVGQSCGGLGAGLLSLTHTQFIHSGRKIKRGIMRWSHWQTDTVCSGIKFQ